MRSRCRVRPAVRRLPRIITCSSRGGWSPPPPPVLAWGGSPLCLHPCRCLVARHSDTPLKVCLRGGRAAATHGVLRAALPPWLPRCCLMASWRCGVGGLPGDPGFARSARSAFFCVCVHHFPFLFFYFSCAQIKYRRYSPPRTSDERPWAGSACEARRARGGRPSTLDRQARENRTPIYSYW